MTPALPVTSPTFNRSLFGAGPVESRSIITQVGDTTIDGFGVGTNPAYLEQAVS